MKKHKMAIKAASSWLMFTFIIGTHTNLKVDGLAAKELTDIYQIYNFSLL